MAGTSFGKMYPTILKVTIQRLLLLLIHITDFETRTSEIKYNWSLRRGQTLKIENLIMRQVDNIVKTGLLTTNLSWRKND